MSSKGPLVDAVDGESTVKPVLMNEQSKKVRKKKKGGLKWDEDKIKEHDLLRGTRQKIDEAATPYHNYDSGSETDGSHNAANNNSSSGSNGKSENTISWDHLQNKLDAAAFAQDAYPSSPSSHGANSGDEKERRRKDIKALEFKEHRKRHYNEMELVRRFRRSHSDLTSDEDDDGDNGRGHDEENDADDEI